MKKFVCLLLLALCWSLPAWACTTMIVGKGATTDGSVLVTHSEDDELADQRIVYVPAKDHPKGDKRPVFATNFPYPRIVNKDRAPAYATHGKPTKILGYIPQVEHTYAYFDGNYGIINEHQLSFGECTDGAKYEPDPAKDRLFYSAQLSRVALERCKKAREAVKLMGELIDKYGYYGTGETLLVGDTEEAWVMEMCGIQDDKTNSLWVAKKVPDGHYFVAANEFRIREVKKDDPDMMYSPDMFKALERVGWWKPSDGPLDWLKAVSNGEYNHPYYSLRRVWRCMDRVNPGLKLSPWVKNGYTKEYPFSIKPAKKLGVRDIFSLYRDHYEGTPFDMTKGLAAGPFGDPNRYIGPYDGNQNDVTKKQDAWGAWERPVSVFYMGYVYVNQSRGNMPDAVGGISWIGPDVAHSTCFVPFYVGVTDLPKSYQTGSPQKFDKNSAWWAFDFVGNIVNLRYRDMIKNDVAPLQDKVEEYEVSCRPGIDQAALELHKKNPELARAYLTQYCGENADSVVDKWWNLGYTLIRKYSDGYLNTKAGIKETGYPKWWLEKVGYADGPLSYKKPVKQ